MSLPILLVAHEAAANPVAEALRRELDIPVEIAPNRRTGLAHLRRGEFSLVLIEENLAAADPDATDMLYQNAVSAPVLEINFVISSAARIIRQARAAITRAALERTQARAAATASLQNELNSSLAGLLLESQLALRTASSDIAPKIRHLVELAGDLRERLRAQP